jgi:hypothetical protein
LSIFVALLTFHNKEKKKKISHFKMPTLNSDVTVNSQYFLPVTNGYLSLKFENFAVLSKNIHYFFDNKNLSRRLDKNIENCS